MTLFNIKFLPIVLLVALIFLQYQLWFENGGIRDMLKVKKQLALQLQINEKIKKRNDQLTQQIYYLQHTKNALEGQARDELGMIKKGETFYQVVQ